MKKLLIVLMVVIIGLLVGCGNEETVNNTTEETGTAPEETLSVLQESLQESADVTFDKEHKTYKIFITDEGAKLYILRMMANEVPIDEWNDMVDIYEALSETISEKIGTEYAIQLHNPANEDKVILILMNGTVIYDAVNGIEL